MTEEELDRATDPNRVKKAAPTFYTTRNYPNLERLIEKHGIAEANRKLSMSDSGLQGMLKKGEVRPVYELAAEMILTKENPTRAANTMLIVRVPMPKLELVTTFLKGLRDDGVSYIRWDEKFGGEGR